MPEPVLEKDAGLTVKQADLSTTSSSDSPPPSYSSCAAQEPPPDISAAFANLSLQEPSALTQTPTPDECLAHLKLLEAFYALRQDISQHDGLFGINDSFATDNSERERTEQLAKIREKRWQVYVSKTSKRFEAWWFTCVSPKARRQTQYAVTTVGRTPWIGEKLQFERQNLPPLGKHVNQRIGQYLNTDHQGRRCHGLACLSTQPKEFSRRLHTIRKDGCMEDRSSVGGDQLLHRQSLIRIQCRSRSKTDVRILDAALLG